MFIALARYAGLASHYQQIDVKPQWQIQGKWLTISRHINVTAYLNGQQYHVDLKPLSKARQLHNKRITDNSAHAQYYNNTAMAYLFDMDLSNAYRFIVKALSLDPSLDFLWSNLGLIYKTNQQFAAAVQAYQIAINLNPRTLTALNNLVALYQQTGQREKAKRFKEIIAHYQQGNPFHHARIGHAALARGQYQQAIAAFSRAIQLKKDEVDFYFELSEALHFSGDNLKAISRLNQTSQLVLTSKQQLRYQQLMQSLRPHIASQ